MWQLGAGTVDAHVCIVKKTGGDMLLWGVDNALCMMTCQTLTAAGTRNPCLGDMHTHDRQHCLFEALLTIPVGCSHLSVELLEALTQAQPAGEGHAVLSPGKDPRNGSQSLHPSALLPPATPHTHAQPSLLTHMSIRSCLDNAVECADRLVKLLRMPSCCQCR